MSEELVDALNELVVELTEFADSMRDLLATIVTTPASIEFLRPTIRSTIERYDNFIMEA